MAHIMEPRVRETSTTTGTTNFTLDGRMFGSLAFSNVMANGDTCDYVASYGDTFEEGIGTYSGGVLQRTTVTRSRHANGTVDANKVSFAAGIKTVILHFGSKRLRDFYTNGALRFDVAQSLNDTQKNQMQANFGRLPAEPGTRMLFQQSTAPVGWVKDATLNNRALRIVSGTVGSGGSLDFSTVFGRTATDNFTLTTSHIPSHRHNVYFTDPGHYHTEVSIAFSSVASGGGGSGAVGVVGVTGIGYTGAYISDGASNLNVTTYTGDGTAHQHGIDLRVKYTDVIVAQKS